MTNLGLGGFLGKRDEYGRPPQITVVLWNLVFQDEMIAEGIPGQFRQQTVVLVRIVRLVGEYQVRRNQLLQFFKNSLHFGAVIGHESVGKFLQDETIDMRAAKRLRRELCLRPTNANGAEDDPVKGDGGVLLDEAQNRAAAADLDVVGMRTEAQNLKRSIRS